MIIESLLIEEGFAGRVGRRPEDSPQIAILPDLIEHLPDTEGLDVYRRRPMRESRWKEDISDRAMDPMNLGDRSWGRGPCRSCGGCQS
jgi:hypothetical protein